MLRVNNLIGFGAGQAGSLFPVVEGVASDEVGNATTFAMDLPASIASGDMIIIFCTCSAGRSLSTPSGYTLVDSYSSDPTYRLWYKVAAGGETSATTSWSGAADCFSFALRVTNYQGTPDLTETVGQSSFPINPPSHTPSGGSGNYLWAAFAGGYDAAPTASVTGWSSGYDDNQLTITSTGTNKGTGGMCTKVATGSVDDPGTWTLTGTMNNWNAVTLALEGPA